MRPYMTEDEAKKKWCPMFPDDLRGTDSDTCIGSLCMWWGHDVRIHGLGINNQGEIVVDKAKGRCEAPGMGG